MLLLYFISLLYAGLMKLKVDVIVNPVLVEQEDTGLVELAIASEDLYIRSTDLLDLLNLKTVNVYF